MRFQSTALITLAAAILLWPASAFAKRRAPSPVPPIVWQGVEYRAPLDVEHMGHVQAIELSSGQTLWETKVYRVWITPLAEEDVRWVFISAMQIQNGKLLVRNENGKNFELNLKTGRVEGAMRYWTPWSVGGGLVLILGFFAWIRYRCAKSTLPQIYADENDKTDGDLYMLNIAGSVRDIERYKGKIRSGMRVLFNVQGEFEVEGTIEYNTENKMWLGRPDFSTRRDL